MDEKKYISSVKLPDNSYYELKDIEAQKILTSLFTDTIILDCGSSTEDIE